MPTVAYLLSVLQQLLNPDQEQPERCLFQETLFTKFIVGAVLPVLVTGGVLTGVTLPWYATGKTCGFRPVMKVLHMGRDIALTFVANFSAMDMKWNGEGRLRVGTFARLVQSEHAVLDKYGTSWKRRMAQGLYGFKSDSDRTIAVVPGQEVWVKETEVGGPEANDFSQLDHRELMRLLRMASYEVSGFMPKAQLLRLLRFTVDSDDVQYDPRPPPLQIKFAVRGVHICGLKTYKPSFTN
jgi:hypothetical protein